MKSMVCLNIGSYHQWVKKYGFTIYNKVYIKLMECYNFIVTLHKINIIFILNTLLILIKIT